MLKYISKHWRGDLSLPVSYWVNGILINLTIHPLIILIYNYAQHSHDVSSLSVVNMPIVVWQIVGMWRSASRYNQQHDEKIWGLIVQGLIIVSIVSYCISYFSSLSKIPKEIEKPQIKYENPVPYHSKEGWLQGSL